MLAEIGIHTEEDLRAAGAEAAWHHLAFVLDTKISRNMLYAMQGALEDRDWRFYANPKQ